MNLDNRVALVTGGKRIGAVVAEVLAGHGADIALAYSRLHDEAERAASRIRELGRRVSVIQADLSRPADCEHLIAETVMSLGGLDVLVNMASVYVHKEFDELTVEAWDSVMAVDLRAAFLCAHAAVPHLRARGGGRIVNFSDWIAASGRPRYPGYLPYYVAKAGVIGLTEALALELAGDNILVNAIAPGPILPPPATTEEESRAVEQATPLGRWGGEMEIAKAVMAVVHADFITGETIRVDGGRHVK